MKEGAEVKRIGGLYESHTLLRFIDDASLSGFIEYVTDYRNVEALQTFCDIDTITTDKGEPIPDASYFKREGAMFMCKGNFMRLYDAQAEVEVKTFIPDKEIEVVTRSLKVDGVADPAQLLLLWRFGHREGIPVAQLAISCDLSPSVWNLPILRSLGLITPLFTGFFQDGLDRATKSIARNILENYERNRYSRS